MKVDVFSAEEIRNFIRHPHLIGHLVGMKDLTELHSQWIRETWLDPLGGRIMAHRNGFKTSAITMIGAVWWLLLHPDDRICLLRETWSVANDTLKTIGNYMEHELVQELFRAVHDSYPRATTSRDGRLTWSFKSTITKEGSLDAYGIDTVPTGSHYDVAIMDDIVTIKDRFSRAKRERTIANMFEIMTNIMEPGKPTHVVGTPWHKDDAWTALASVEHREARKYTVHDTGILTEEQIASKKRSMTDVMFTANYLLEHKAGADLKFQDPERGKWEKSPDKVVAHLDASYGGRDLTALTIMQRRTDGSIQAWGRVWRTSAEEVMQDIHREMLRRNCRHLFLETNGDKGFLAKIMRKFGSDGQVVRTTPYHEKQDKHTKIDNYLGHHWHDLVWAEDTDEAYLSCIVDYSEGATPDDPPDSAASLLREFFFPQEGNGAAWKALYQQ